MVLFAALTSAQSPYQLDQRDWLFAGAGLGLYAGGLALGTTVDGLSASEISSLNREDVNGFDRLAIGPFHDEALACSDALAGVAGMAPLMLALQKNVRTDLKMIAVMATECFLWSYGSSEIAKNLTKRARPFVYRAPLHLDPMAPDARRSFYSAHTTFAATMSFFTASVFSAYYPDSRYKGLVWIGAATIPALTGVTRVLAGKHFPTDILVGYAIGAVTGVVVPQLHLANHETSWQFTIVPGYARMAFTF